MRRVRWIAIILIVLLAFSFAYVGAESVHECEGDHCPVCTVLTLITRVFAASALFLLLVCVIAFVRRVMSRVSSGVSGCTLISMKVKLSD